MARPPTPPIALTIAGSDPSGGAGVQADLKTFHQHGVYGQGVLTLLTVQSTREVSAVRVLDPDFVVAQLRAVLADMPPGAAKTGALGDTGVIETLADEAARFTFPLVVDPVMISKHGAPLLPPEAMLALRTRLLPHALLVTPNLHEAAELSGFPVRNVDDMRRAAERIASFGPANVLVKGGHLEGESVDVLFCAGRCEQFSAERIDTPHTHGTGCTYSAAITANLARGMELVDAVREAKTYITEAIRTAPGLGTGCGPVNHFAQANERVHTG